VTADVRVEDLLRELAPRVLGVLVRRYEDFAVCEDAVQEALVAARHWTKEGVPSNPRSWLVTAASRAVVDEWRSVRARRRREETVAALEPPDQAVPSGQDDSLALLLMCCHPVLPVSSQLALTLRAVGGVAPLVDVLTEAPGVGVPAVADPMVPLEHRALRLGPQQGDLGILLGRTVAVLDQPAGRQQATQRPPPADHVEVDVGAVAGDDVAEVLGVPHREDGEVPQRVALAAFGPIEDAGDLVTVDEDVADLQVAVHEHRRRRPERPLGEPPVVRDHVGRKDLVGDEPLALAVEL
jgi:Sigma-70 region 2